MTSFSQARWIGEEQTAIKRHCKGKDLSK